MAMKIVGANYQVKVLGDGTTSSIAVDFYDQIQADQTVHNKVPDDVVPSGGDPSMVLSGTTVTFTWGTPMDAGRIDIVVVQLTFPK